MPSNSLSRWFGITTFGESHGPYIGVVIDSPIPNIDFPSLELESALRRRALKSKFTTDRNEPDQIHIISGVFEGKTTGMPLCILVPNKDAKSEDYEAFRDVFRPGHADASWFKKYGIYDYRGGGRASGRETIARLIAADSVKSLLKGIEIRVQTLSVGKISADPGSFRDDNPFHWPDPKSYPELIKYLESISRSSDSVGATLRVTAHNVPPGLGDPIFEKLSANIAKAMFSIGSIRGILFGDGLRLAIDPGSLVNDQYKNGKPQSNHHGGILGGVSTGQDLSFDLIIRPISSIGIPQKTVDKSGNPQTIAISGRHDSCHIPRVIPVVEAMLGLCLADAIQYQKLIAPTKPGLNDYRESLDKLDEELVLLLWRRRSIVNQVNKYKREHQIPPIDPQREQEILKRSSDLANNLDLDPKITQEIQKLCLQLCKK